MPRSIVPLALSCAGPDDGSAPRDDVSGGRGPFGRTRQRSRGMGRRNGKVAVITGATSGIGLRTAELFVAEGARIVIAGRRAAEGDALARQLGAACLFRQTDVTLEDQMRALIALAIDKFGRIDCLFNNAGGPAQT